MAQHDYNIANATFPNTRTDINNALSAVATNNSGDAQPSTMFANQWWYETDQNKLHIRNEDNDAWIHILTLNQTNDTVTSVEGGATLAGIDDQSSSNDDQITITDSAVVINEDSDDVDFRVETNGNANMLFISGGNDVVGIGAEGDLGVGLHIKSADSGASVDGNADELAVEGSGHSGMTICSGNSSTGTYMFADDGDADRAFMRYDHSVDDMFFSVAGNGTSYALGLFDGNQLSSGGETAPDTEQGGFCFDTNAGDGKIISFKSSDVAHGMTSSCETDTYAHFSKQDSNKGGMAIRVFSEDINSERLNINIQGEGDLSETKSTSAKGGITIGSSAKSGTGQGSSNSDGIIMSISNYTTTCFLFEGDGNFHADAGSNTYDAYEDAHLARAYDLSHGKGVIESKFDKFVAYNHEKLAQLDLVGREEDGTPNHFINVTGMQRLHNGAIWQQYEKHQRLATAMYELAKEAVGEEKANAILEKNEIKLLN